MLLSRLCGEPIGFTVIGIFVIDRNTVLTVGYARRVVFIKAYHRNNVCQNLKIHLNLLKLFRENVDIFGHCVQCGFIVVVVVGFNVSWTARQLVSASLCDDSDNK